MRWAGDRCTVCDSDVDYDMDQLVSCDMCGITVHQSCYGVAEVPGEDDMWLCRACELKVRPACLCLSEPRHVCVPRYQQTLQCLVSASEHDGFAQRNLRLMSGGRTAHPCHSQTKQHMLSALGNFAVNGPHA